MEHISSRLELVQENLETIAQCLQSQIPVTFDPDTHHAIVGPLEDLAGAAKKLSGEE